MEYDPGERMRFGFTVLGRAADYMPYFIFAFPKMGEDGVGRLKARYELEKVVAENPLTGAREEVFDGGVVKNHRLPVSWEDEEGAVRGLDGERLRLEFLTPTFVKFRGRVSPEAPSFQALVQALFLRIPMLSAVHCGEVWREDFKAMVERAGEVETIADETTWVSFRRYSSFKKKGEALKGWWAASSTRAPPSGSSCRSCAWASSCTSANVRSSGLDAIDFSKFLLVSRLVDRVWYLARR